MEGRPLTGSPFCICSGSRLRLCCVRRKADVQANRIAEGEGSGDRKRTAPLFAGFACTARGPRGSSRTNKRNHFRTWPLDRADRLVTTVAQVGGRTSVYPQTPSYIPSMAYIVPRRPPVSHGDWTSTIAQTGRLWAKLSARQNGNP